ncbi:MAG: 50S ribosomal protein L9 [Planctomycetota bacterium]
MAKTLELLLTENVDSLGIVGDIVRVKPGYARNFLLPRGLATAPSQDLIDALADKRKQAEAELAALRKHQGELVEKLTGYELVLERSCNDQGQLYGSVTQQDIADALRAAGHDLRDRDVRLNQTIKRIGHYDVPIKFTPELETELDLVVNADRPLAIDDEPEEEPTPAEGTEATDGGETPTEPAASPQSPETEPEPVEA